MKQMQGPLYEYACTEGNYGLANILRGARVEEQEQDQFLVTLKSPLVDP